MTEQSSLSVASEAKIERTPGTTQALACVNMAAPFRAELIALDRRMTSAQALVVIGTSCVRQISLNQRGVRHGSGEALHQMRVGLRRLRAAFSIFESVIRQGEFDDLKRELVWLTEQLGAARDYDVLLQSKRQWEVLTATVFDGSDELTCELSRRQQEAFAVARRAVVSARFERLIFAAAVALISRADEEGRGDGPVRALARRILARRTRRVLRRLGNFARLDPSQRHELRIRIKKLRYATEFFATLFPHSNRRRKRFSDALEALQDTLGRLNDIGVHQRIAAELIQDGAQAGRQAIFGLGALTGDEQAEVRSLLESIPKLRARFARAPRFWR
ncbi:MAG TPA: CHAD domain-containing protein [Polyangiaceae bacterium]|nr:CHAD domain-containing protein [Polyangiaceae bacterium]